MRLAVADRQLHLENLKLERDARFPVRVTIQFYKATSNGVVSDQDLADAAGTINYEIVTRVSPRVPRVHLHAVEDPAGAAEEQA